MNIETFSRVLRSFADSAADIDLARGRLCVQVRDAVIEAQLLERAGDLTVEENGERLPAGRWLINRVAKLPTLADRIIEHVDLPSTFIAPAGRFLDQLVRPEGSVEVDCENAVETLRASIDSRLAGFTSATYLTSDAGEGKTTVLGYLAKQQAKAFKERKTNWLLLPVPLGGKAFLHFDDVVIAALVNKYRFSFFYYEAFIELVKLGVVVPAFDGFEEMFVETSSGEAISALGNLVNALGSEGSVVIAARKAYFDYQSFRTQAKLFDSVGKHDVAFSRISLERWGRTQFLQLANSWGIKGSENLYEALVERLTADHPLLTRAVLASRLIEEAIQTDDTDKLVQKLGSAPKDYFHTFVNTIVEREAREKWTDKSGEPFKPLLSVEEHHDLLGLVAAEMWGSGVEVLRADVLDIVSDLFCEQKKLGAAVVRQVKERLKQHALITISRASRGQYAFDHEDFRNFYLGESLGRSLATGRTHDVHAILKAGTLSTIAVEQACLLLARSTIGASAVVQLLQSLAESELPMSYVRENCGALVMYLVTAHRLSGLSVSKMTMVASALSSRVLDGVSFVDCYFQPTSVAGSKLQKCEFLRCEFERLEIARDASLSCSLIDCRVSNLVVLEEDRQVFNPSDVVNVLHGAGFSVRSAQQQALPLHAPAGNPDQDTIELIERALRTFLRATQINEGTLRVRLGARASEFIDTLLPRLLDEGVMEEVSYRGGGVQRRFRLGVPMEDIQNALTECTDDLERFYKSLR